MTMHTFPRYYDVNTSDPNVTSLMTYEAYMGLGAYLVITGLVGGAGNVLVVVMFVTEKQLKSSVDLLLLNLAVADVGMCGVCFPFVSASNFAQHWLFGEAGCTVYGYLGFFFGNAAICTLSAISVQRYLVVCKRHSNNRSLATFGGILFIWIQAILWSSFPLLLPKPYDLEPFGTSCTVAWSSPEPSTRIFIYLLVSWVVLNGVVMAACYLSIYLNTRSTIVTTSRRSHHDLLVSKICFLLVAAFVLCWMPYSVFSLWYATTSTHVPALFSALPVMLAKVSACINPLLYIVASQRFRNKFLRLLTCNKQHTVDIQHAACPHPDNPPPSALT